jgi:putative adenylate-forming enzyme
MASAMRRLVDALALVRHYLAARRQQRLGCRRDLDAHQQRQWRRLHGHVVARAPFYASHARQPFDEFPVIDKHTWMRHFDDINTSGITLAQALAVAEEAERTRDFAPSLGGISVGLSTGTSGARGVFLASRSERLRWAGTLLAKMLPDGILAPARVALLLRAGSNLYDTLSGGLRLRFRYFDLAAPFAEVLARLAEFQPGILVGPPSVLALAADAVLAGTLRLAPRRVIAAAEVLDPVDAERITAAFGVRIEQIYQATEGFLGHTCRHGSVHLNEDCLIVERDWIDRATRRFAPIVTDLYRRTQPVIRYRLNDVLVEREQSCPCGSPFIAIERIEGREDDIVWLGNALGAGLVPLFPDLLSRTLLNAAPHATDYLVEQHEIDTLRIAVQPDLSDDQRQQVRQAIADCSRQLGACVPRLSFDIGIEHSATRKCRRVRRLFKLGEAPHA